MLLYHRTPKTRLAGTDLAVSQRRGRSFSGSGTPMWPRNWCEGQKRSTEYCGTVASGGAKFRRQFVSTVHVSTAGTQGQHVELSHWTTGTGRESATRVFVGSAQPTGEAAEGLNT
jgi:hypothetical protein